MLPQLHEEKQVSARRAGLPSLSSIINLNDFEKAAEHVLGPDSKARAYFASTADDGKAASNSRESFNYIQFLPRVLVPVSRVDIKTRFLGTEVSIPVFIAPAGEAGLGHPKGELNLTRGAAQRGALQTISNHSSYSLDDILAARDLAVHEVLGKPVLWFQLYVHRDRKISQEIVEKAIQGGCEAIVLTADAPVLGNREKHRRAASDYAADRIRGSDLIGGAQFEEVDANLTWEIIKWIKTVASKTPVLVKGLSATADVELAYQHGCKGVILSNHGGRQLDSVPAPLAVLIRLRREADFQKRKAEGFEIYIDGGVRRGSDVVKALCCGANGVALGRPFMYAQSCYGEEGVKRVFDIMEEEIATTMQLLGVTSIDQLGPQYVELLDGLLGNRIV